MDSVAYFFFFATFFNSFLSCFMSSFFNLAKSALEAGLDFFAFMEAASCSV